MKVLIAAGGTGGHIYPGIAVAREIERRNETSEILFVGSDRGLEKKIVPESGFQLSLIKSAGLKNVGLIGKIRGLAILPVSFFEARRIIRNFDPDVVVGMGGYVTGPVLLMASLMRISTLVMDSNALPGYTNRVLAKFVTKAALAFDDALAYFGDKGIVTGNPVRKEFFEIMPKERSSATNLLLFGGSQGARALNIAMVDALGELNVVKSDLNITHQTGQHDFQTVGQGYDEKGWETAKITVYISDMVSEFRDADLIISRAGATTCAELSAAGKAAIMIPLPTAADDHQRKNAEAMQVAGAAIMILQKELSGQRLAVEIKRLMKSPDLITAMEIAARKLARSDAAEATVDLIDELAGEPDKAPRSPNPDNERALTADK